MVSIDDAVGAILALIHRWNLPQFLYNWQTLEAGVLALVAGLITVRVINKQVETTVRLERERVASEREAIRIALAEEIWWLLRHLLDTHKGLKELSARPSRWSARDVQDFLRLREPVIYPPIAAKIGFIPQLAPYVVAFYGNLEHIRSAVRIATADPAETLTAKKLDEIAALFQQAFQENALPLLNQLPEDQANTEFKQRIEAMGLRIAISQAAFDAIAKTLPLGSVGYENATNEKGERLIWLEPSMVDRLRAMRGPGESWSDVILRLAGEG